LFCSTKIYLKKKMLVFLLVLALGLTDKDNTSTENNTGKVEGLNQNDLSDLEQSINEMEFENVGGINVEG
ncbi:hypothetical protein ACFL0X_01475, partial [Nanoarchaeota archaeon]